MPILRDLYSRARRVNGGTALDSPDRAATLELTARLVALYDAGTSFVLMDRAIGARPGTCRRRAVRHQAVPDLAVPASVTPYRGRHTGDRRDDAAPPRPPRQARTPRRPAAAPPPRSRAHPGNGLAPTPVDLVGMVTGRLTVTARHDEAADEWRCRCTCGREVIASRVQLVRGIQSCGCPPHRGRRPAVRPAPGSAPLAPLAEAAARRRRRAVTRPAGPAADRAPTRGVPAAEILDLRRLWARARRVNGSTPLDHPDRAASLELAAHLAALHADGVAYTVIDDVLLAERGTSRRRAARHDGRAVDRDRYRHRMSPGYRGVAAMAGPRTPRTPSGLPDLVGRTFDRLTVTARHGDQVDGTEWECRCACGRRVIVKHRQILRGIRSCGACMTGAGRRPIVRFL